ncbi:MAG: ABC transporter substrate-binding protein [Treponema sp.]|jgi:polar amino acid transport system substrate-binding protein|nr:ABC transporter substrate-binding protein [Treponema sp.]
MKKAMITMMAILMAGSIFFAGCTKKPGITLKPGTLMIAMDAHYPPMEYFDADGKTPIGFDVDMGKAISEKMGLEVQFVNTAWDEIFDGLNADKYDCIMSSVTINPDRQAAFNFSKPYVSNTLAMVLLKGSAIRARTPEESIGLNVAFQDETTSEQFMRKLESGGLRFNLREYDKVMNCFDELKRGRVDVVITDLLVAYDYIAPADSPFEIVWTSPDDEKFGICMKKGNDALTEAIDKALDSLFEEGTMHRISQNIFGMDMVSAARR